jgi:hypothetical protein
MNQHEENIEVMKDLRARLDKVINSDKKEETKSKIPDPTKHKYISFFKSGLRIIAGATLMLGDFYIAGGLFIVAEVLGVIEEMV